MKPLNIGLVGYGFMGRTHSNAFRQAPIFFDLPWRPVLKAVAARNGARVKSFAENWGWESYHTDWRDLVARPDIDLIDIASPNDTHHEIAIAAAKAGKMVMCEKPLGRNAKEASEMVAAVEAAGVPNSVWYNYRFVPAVTACPTTPTARWTSSVSRARGCGTMQGSRQTRSSTSAGTAACFRMPS